MNIRNSYKTKQKDLILKIIKEEQKEFTIKDIYEKLNKKIGLTTIYRLIDKLVEENIIKKTIDKKNITHYQYLEKCDKDNHFYLKCIKCKTLFHIDCDCIDELTNHIIEKHKFSIIKENIIINGICNKCKLKGE